MYVETKRITHKEEQTMTEFLMFYAPFIVLIGSIIVAFWAASKDGAVKEE